MTGDPDDLRSSLSPATRDRLLFLLDHVSDRLDVLEAHLRAECARGNGCWMDPAPTACGRPGTHLYELNPFGIHATGMTVPEAVRAWRIRAMSELLGDTGEAA
jgi:hypothetical protein